MKRALTQKYFRRLSEEREHLPAIMNGAVVVFSSRKSLFIREGYVLNFQIQQSVTYECAWIPGNGDSDPWIQVGTTTPRVWTKIDTQGKYSTNDEEWVTKFKIKYSLDGQNWIQYHQGQEFEGNQDKNSIKTNIFANPFLARSVRIFPTAYHTSAALRLELYYVEIDEDDLELIYTGDEIAAIATGAKTYVHSVPNCGCYRENYFLESSLTYGDTADYNGWRPYTNSYPDWFQISVNSPKLWTKIVTKGSIDENTYIKQYEVQYSLDGSEWNYIMEGSSVKTFPANTDTNTPQANIIENPFLARIIRILPTDYTADEALRIEAYFKDLYNLKIDFEPGSQYAAIEGGGGVLTSSYYNPQHYEGYRLNQIEFFTAYRFGGWLSSTLDRANQWIQVGTLSTKKWVKIQTYGRYDYEGIDYSRVTKYKVEYSLDGYDTSWNLVDSGIQFIANQDDSYLLVTNSFTTPVNANIIRVFPTDSIGNPYLRVEIYYEEPSRELFYSGEFSALNSGAYFRFSSLTDLSTEFNYRLDFSNSQIYRTSEDSSAWISISTAQLAEFTGIAVRSEDNSKRTGTFTAQYSIDGINWNYVDAGNEFVGSLDHKYSVRNRFATPVIARAIKVFPMNSLEAYFSFQVEVFYKTIEVNEIYSTYSGLEVGALEGGAGIMYSSYYYDGSRSLEYLFGFDMDSSGFKFDNSDSTQFFQIGVVQQKKWTKIEIKGAEFANEYIEQFDLQYSLDGETWTTYSSSFAANTDSITLVTKTIGSPFLARAIKIIPTTFSTSPSFRIRPYYEELTSSELSSASDMSVEIAAIATGAAVEVSSSAANEYRVGYGLNTKMGIVHCWKPANDNEGEWIQIGIVTPKLWTKIITQGRHEPDEDCSGSCNEFVETYKIKFSADGNTWSDYNNGNKITANTDTTTEVTYSLSPEINAVAIRIYPVDFSVHMSLRLEAYYKEFCDWRCNDCTIGLDSTKCSSCISLEGIETTANGDGTYTCLCGTEFWTDSENEVCLRKVYETKFELSSSSSPLSNLGNSGTFSVSQIGGILNPEEHIGQLFFGSSTEYLEISSEDLKLGQEGIIFSFGVYVESKIDQYILSTNPSNSDYQFEMKLTSEGYIQIKVPHIYYGSVEYQTLFYPLKTWFLVVLTLKNDLSLMASTATLDLMVEGETSWEETFTIECQYKVIQFIEESSYLFDIGVDLIGVIHSFQIISFNGELPYSREHFLNCDSSCLSNSLCLGILSIEDGCTRCSSSFPVLLDLSEGRDLGNCLIECIDGYYSDNFGDFPKCVKCSEGCKKCNNNLESQCTDCLDGYLLNIDSSSETIGNCILENDCEKAQYTTNSINKCGPVSVSISGNSEVSRYSENIFSGIIFPSLKIDSEVTYSWSIISGPSLDISSYSNTASITIPFQQLIIDNSYEISVEVIFENSFTVNAANFEFLVVNPIQIIINGGTEIRSYSIGASFSIDASDTYTTDSSIPTLYFEWNCYRYLTLPKKNCLLYDGESVSSLFTGSVLNIQKKYFLAGTLYFELKVYNTDCEKTQFPLTVSLSNIPSFTATLILPSGAKLPTSQSLQFSIEITPAELSLQMTYTWEVSLDLLPITIGISPIGNSLTISSNSLLHGRTYTISCKVENDQAYLSKSASFTTSLPIDTSSATLQISPDRGEALKTIFTITASGFVDGEGGILYYSFKYRKPAQSTYQSFAPIGVSNSFTTRIGNSAEDFGVVEIIVQVSNLYEESVNLVQVLILDEPDLSEPSSYVSQQLATLNSEDKLEFISAAASTLINNEYNEDYSSITDVCGGCNQKGVCNTTTSLCICQTGYTVSKNCRIKNSEATQAQAIISSLLKESVTQFFGDSEAKTKVLSVIKEISDNQDILSIEQNEQIQDIMDQFVEDPSLLTRDSSQQGIQVIANLLDSSTTQFKQSSSEDSQIEATQKAAEILKTNSVLLQARCSYLENKETQKLNVNANMKIVMKKTSTEDLEGLTLHYSDSSSNYGSSIELPSGLNLEFSDPISVVQSEYATSPIQLTDSGISSICSDLELSEEESTNSTTTLLNAVSLELFQNDNSLTSSQLSSPIKVKFALKDSETRRRLSSSKNKYTCLRFDSELNELSSEGMEIGEIVEGEYAICLASVLTSQGLYSIAVTALAATFDAIIENVESLTDFGALSDYDYYKSLMFYLCNGLVLIMIITIIFSERARRKQLKLEELCSKNNYRITIPVSEERRLRITPQVKIKKNVITNNPQIDIETSFQQNQSSNYSNQVPQNRSEKQRHHSLSQFSKFLPKNKISLSTNPDSKRRPFSSTPSSRRSYRIIKNVHPTNSLNLSFSITPKNSNSINKFQKESLTDIKENPEKSEEKTCQNKRMGIVELCELYTGTHVLLAPFFNIKSSLNRTKRIMIYFFELFLVILISGIFFDSVQGDSADSNSSLIVKAFFAFLSLSLSVPFSSILSKILQTKHKKSKFKSKSNAIRNIIGVILFIGMSGMCIVWINILSAKFDHEMTNQWIQTVSLALLIDYLIIQNLKCGITLIIMKIIGKKKEEDYSICEVFLALVLDAFVIATIAT